MLTPLNPQDYDFYVAIDTSKKSYAVTYMNHERHRKSLTMPADAQALHHYFQKRFSDRRLLYVYEAGPTGYDLYDYLTTQGQSCMIVHPPSIPKAPKDRVKNNRIDSQKLAEQALGGQLQGIRVPDSVYRQLRHLATSRQQYAEDIKKAKQRIKALLLFENISLPQELDTYKHWSKRYRNALRELPVKNSIIRLRLDTLLDDLQEAHLKLLRIHRYVRDFCAQDPGLRKNTALLRSLPGFGFVVSMYLLSRMGHPQSLRNVRELGSFAGLVPSEHSTGEDDNRGSITHMGDAELRRLLIQAAWIAIRKDPELRQFYHRIRAKNSRSKASQVAIVAVARKLTMRVYRVLKDQRPYVIYSQHKTLSHDQDPET